MAGKHIPSTYETRLVRKNNEIVPIEISAAKTIWKDRPAVMVQARDITKRKKIEEKLKLASLYNRSLIEASLDPLVTIGPNGKINDVNKATETVTGYLRDEIIGSDFSDYFTEPVKAKEDYRQVFKEGFVRDYTLEIQHKDGHVTPVLYNASVYRDESGNVVGVFAAARDITEYKKAEDALRESEEKYRDIFEESFDGLFITSPEGKILDMNKKGIEMFGYNTKEEILNLDLVHDAYSDPNDRKKIFPMVNEQGSAEYEVVVKKKNGDKMITRCSLIAVKDKGVITTYRGIIRDITESKKTENEIKKSLEEKEVLLREIHHRVKNNLQIIASLLHLQEVSEEEKEIVDVLKESEGRVKSMAMVHEKLYQSPTFSDINFKQYIEKLVYDILYTYKIPTGTIKTNMIIEEINLNIDTAIPLGLIVNELVTNSVKHAFPQSEGTIIIKLKSLDEQMELTIADNGIGLSKDLDLEKTETLGIKIVNSLVNQIDGKIKLDRTNGIEFKITFKELKYKERL
jgi:PAS domain S-box-containing protein